ncbi:uncharacterized protein LOC109806272 [Cajanus cajan]|uniref:uncharacterized protein LOC109806272 n=1 Tax=Cajanus cajan TaxID=3821 RepID=UPI00098DBD15|nr:uncharacterized protein LOC109806272 [Cajanus cajan]
MENVQYTTWVKLFKIHARSHKAIDHIIPPTKGKEKIPQTEEEKELWSTLDATVLQWIYATISHDLLHIILELDTMTIKAWNRLRDIFQNNKHSHAVTLEYDFTHTDMADFPNVFAYCQHLKSLSDQLKHVGFLVDNNRLVLQLVLVSPSPTTVWPPLFAKVITCPNFIKPVRCSLLNRSALPKR